MKTAAEPMNARLSGSTGRAAPLHELARYVRRHPGLYLLLIPGVVYLLVFEYVPMYGLIIAFKDFNFVKGIWGSDWIGLQNFTYLFTSKNFWHILRNSVVISLLKIVWGFPAPIILALMLNEVGNMLFKRVSQTVMYLPHFISWVVIAGMMFNLLSPSTGLFNKLVVALGGEPIAFLARKEFFRTIVVVSSIWKEAGWGTIVFLAAISGIDPTLYESAIIDGANRLQRARYITIPGIIATVIVLLILQISYIMSNGFEQIFMLYNPLTYEVADVFETYTYRHRPAGGPLQLRRCRRLLQVGRCHRSDCGIQSSGQGVQQGGDAVVSIRLRRPAAFDIVNYLVLTLFSVTMLYPFVNTAAVAFSDYGSYLSNPLRVLPGRVSFAAFQKVFDTPRGVHQLHEQHHRHRCGRPRVTGHHGHHRVPVVEARLQGTWSDHEVHHLHDVVRRRTDSGLLPIPVTRTHHSLGAVILKPLLAGFNVILMKVYFEVSIPDSIEEAAIIDGASDLQVLFKIVVPLSAPMMATIGLFQAVGYWNNFYWPLIFLQDTSRWTLPILLREIITEASNYGVIPNEAEKEYIPPQTIKNAALIITIVPIICVYPFLQRHFTKGIMLGAVKE